MYPDQCKTRRDFNSNKTTKTNNSYCLSRFIFLSVLTLNSFNNKVLTQIMHNRKLTGIMFYPFLCNTDVFLQNFICKTAINTRIAINKIFTWICIRSGSWWKRLIYVIVLLNCCYLCAFLCLSMQQTVISCSTSSSAHEFNCVFFHR